MTSRTRIVRSIPFWVLLVVSLVLTAVGAWLVLDHLGRIEAGILSQTQEGAIAVYVSPSAATTGAVVLGAGLVGLLLALTVATLSTILPRPDAEIVEPIDWADDEESTSEPILPGTAAASAPFAASTATAATTEAEPAAAPEAPLTHGDPVLSDAPAVSEDPDVEVPSDRPAPPAADR